MAPATLLGALLAGMLFAAATPAQVLTLEPVADTYVEPGLEGTWDHGGCRVFDVDSKPLGISYLKFDLTGLAANRYVVSAKLTLTCTNSTPDGGTVYPVPRSDWTEGEGCGPDGPGLSWVEYTSPTTYHQTVDCNFDGKVDADDQDVDADADGCGAFVPDFSRPLASLGRVKPFASYTVDVTEAFDRGADVYTLAIANGSFDGATYRSREYSSAQRRPSLTIEVGTLEPSDSCAEPRSITVPEFTERVDTTLTSFDDGDPEPTCVRQPARNNVWYAYTAATDGMVRVSTNGSSYDTGVAVYMGTCGTLAEIGCAGDACFGDGTPSRVSFPAVAGTTYLIMVWGEAYPHAGTLVLHLSQLDVCEG
jgi:hypothetical protein